MMTDELLLYNIFHVWSCRRFQFLDGRDIVGVMSYDIADFQVTQ